MVHDRHLVLAKQYIKLYKVRTLFREANKGSKTYATVSMGGVNSWGYRHRTQTVPFKSFGRKTWYKTKFTIRSFR